MDYSESKKEVHEQRGFGKKRFGKKNPNLKCIRFVFPNLLLLLFHYGREVTLIMLPSTTQTKERRQRETLSKRVRCVKRDYDATDALGYP